MSDRGSELRSLRQEITAVRVLLERPETRLSALEEEDRFEVVYPEAHTSLAEFPGCRWSESLPGASSTSSHPRPGSGGVDLTRASSSSPQPGSGGVQLSRRLVPLHPRILTALVLLILEDLTPLSALRWPRVLGAFASSVGRSLSGFFRSGSVGFGLSLLYSPFRF